jgi:predicted aspartyl protease
MGMFEVKVKLTNLAAPGWAEDVSLLVDAGATLSWIPWEVLDRLGAIVFSRLPFERADGRRLERDVTTVLLTVDGRKAPVPVAFGEAGEAAVLGATALESLGLLVDPVAQKLIPRNLRMLRAVEQTGLVLRKLIWESFACACPKPNLG